MTQPPPNIPQTTKPHVQFDWQDWLPYIDDSTLTDDQKREMIEALWSIVTAFVDLGWEVGDVPKNSCGQSFDLAAALTCAMVQLQNINLE